MGTWRTVLTWLIPLLFAACTMMPEKSAYQVALERYDNLPASGPDRASRFERFEAELAAAIQNAPSDPNLRLLRAQVRFSRYQMVPESKNANAEQALITSSLRREYPQADEQLMLTLGRGVLEDARAAAKIAARGGDPVRLIEARSERMIGELMTLVSLWGPRQNPPEQAESSEDRQALLALAYLDVAAVHLRQARTLAQLHVSQDVYIAGEADETKIQQVRALTQVLVTVRRDLETILWTQANLLSGFETDALVVERSSVETLEKARDLRLPTSEAAVWDLFQNLLPTTVLDDPEPLWLNGLLIEMSALTEAIDPITKQDAVERLTLIKQRITQGRAALRVGAALEFELVPGRMPSITDSNQRMSELTQSIVDSSKMR